MNDLFIFFFVFVWHELGHIVYLGATGAMKEMKLRWWGVECVPYYSKLTLRDYGLSALSGIVAGFVPLWFLLELAVLPNLLLLSYVIICWMDSIIVYGSYDAIKRGYPLHTKLNTFNMGKVRLE